MVFFSKKFYAIFFFSLSLLFWGCSDDSTDDFVLLPNNVSFYYIELFPNDSAQNDSAAANLSHGISLRVHPQATYQLSFDVDPNYEAPELQLFRIYTNTERTHYDFKQVRAIEPTIVNGRYVYEFTCEENNPTSWATSLVLDGDYFPGKTRNIHLKGNGAYSDHLSLNLIVVGNVEEEVEDFTIKELAQELLKSFRKYYSSITIDTLYIRHADEHPTLGKKYPRDEPWIARNDENIMLSELGGWPGIENALDIVLVLYIDSEGILGYSDLFSGNLGGGNGSTVLLGAHYITPYGKEESISMKSIVETTIHETGHFFGLRHTTTTQADLSQIIDDFDFGDYSNVEDGFKDTPYCGLAQKYGLLKEPAKDWQHPNRLYRTVVFEKANSAPFSIQDCPDANNMMFPTEIGAQELIFSKTQLETIRKNLMIFPH